MICRAVMTVAVLLISVVTTFDSSASRQPAPDALVRVEVATLIPNEEDRNIVLVLKPGGSGEQADEAEKRRVLLLVIGFEEGRSIWVAYQKIGTPRPLTHDLMKNIIEGYGGAVTSCVITKMEQETFFAELRLKRAGREMTVDSRPSDAIALAMRAGAPIYVRRSVLTRHSIDPTRPEKAEKPLKT